MIDLTSYNYVITKVTESAYIATDQIDMKHCMGMVNDVVE